MKRKPLSLPLRHSFFAFLIASTFIFSNCGNNDTSTIISSEADDVPADTSIAFTQRLAAETGIDFNNHVEEKYETFFDTYAYIYTGGGVAVGDINNDGLQDVYFTGNEVKDKLYLNKGNFKFEDISEKSILSGHEGWHNGVTIIDINSDGHNDIYVCRGGWKETPEQRQNLLYINNGDATFTERASDFGLADEGYSMQASFFDIDNDNDLDLYLTNRPDEFYLPLSEMEAKALSGPDCCSDRLYRNDGGKYTDISRQAGIVNFGYSLGLATSDFNNDGYNDIYVSNDFATADHVYINQGDGTFRDELEKSLNHISLFSMGTDIGDINNDGLEDIIVMEMRPEDYIRSKVSMPPMNIEGFHAVVDAGMHKQYMHNMLHLNQGNGVYSEVAQLAGVAKTDWSWSGLFGDFDNDGNRDLFITNGMRRDLFDGDAKKRMKDYVNDNKSKFPNPSDLFRLGFQGLVESYKPLKLKNYLFKGNGDVSFTDVGQNTDISIPSFSNGSAFADFDNDGDFDIIVNNMEDHAFVLENTSPSNNNWIKVKLNGPNKNKSGIGAKVWTYADGKTNYFQQKIIRGYLSSSDENMIFGIGTNSVADSIIVMWPDGKKSKVTNITSNQLTTIEYSTGLKKGLKATKSNQMFTAVNDALSPPHVDQENDVFEYQSQVLLPHSFATSGPKMSAADLNGDGTEDIYIGGSKGEAASLYLSSGSKWIKSDQNAFYLDRIFEDMHSVFLDYDSDGDQDLYVVSGGSEYDRNTLIFQDRLYQNDNGIFTKTRSTLPPNKSNGSHVIKHDFDQDGDDDLFVTGYVKPNEYPLGDESFFLENNGNGFTNSTAKWYDGNLSDLGIVYQSTLSQLDDDPEMEIVLVGEWMPITVLDWNGGQYKNVTQKYGLSKTNGWWNSVKSADLDNDGKDDLIVGNLGENYKFKVDNTHDFEVYANDFDKNGTYDIFLATSSEYGHKPVRGLECSSEQLPVISENFKTFTDFAHADIDDIIGPGIKDAVSHKVDIFSSVVLYNDGNSSFTMKKLPKQSQYSLINSIVINDFNNDGLKDIITAGNRFNVEIETTPSDASVGSYLVNKGNRTLEAIPPYESGIYLRGDIKDVLFINDNIIATENSGLVKVMKKK